MKDKIEAMARLDGWSIAKVCNGIPYWSHETEGMFAGSHHLPDYLDPIEGHGHIQRVIDGLVFPLGLAYYNALIGVCSRDDTDVWNASCEQKVEAVLRCKGAWDD